MKGTKEDGNFKEEEEEEEGNVNLYLIKWYFEEN